MTIEEFNKLITDKNKKPIANDEDWQVINVVYTFHPSIDEVKGKQQVALLYVEFGMRIFWDMLPTAEKAVKIEAKILELKNQTECLQNELRDLKK